MLNPTLSIIYRVSWEVGQHIPTRTELQSNAAALTRVVQPSRVLNEGDRIPLAQSGTKLTEKENDTRWRAEFFSGQSSREMGVQPSRVLNEGDRIPLAQSGTKLTEKGQSVSQVSRVGKWARKC
ncbi:unnamed protein product [Rhizoctonia solani]|uniref:Uncharacterized protein n=1 Tax=Rhizoctonia solani TaxID=456999 RepID=A0A8H3HBI8_9AGAM|nr:unnamed protein product [Rhizoctonia solani]